MIKAIIIDDEKKSRDALAEKLKKCSPEVEVIQQCASAKEGIAAIGSLKPDLVFLDIEMPVMNGFAMLETFPRIDFEIIFTTAYDQYAIKAIRFSALDYLLKPIDINELKLAVQQHEKKIKSRNPESRSTQMELLLQNFKSIQGAMTKIALPTAEGFQMVYIKDIVRLESDSNYCTFYFRDGKKILVSRTLKEYEEMLEEYNFFRVHNSHLVNMQYVGKYVKGEGGYVIMEDGTSIEVSVRRKQQFIQKLAKT